MAGPDRRPPPREMTEKILIILLPLIFPGTFITRNLVVKARTGQRIKASDPLVTLSIVLTNLCIFNTIFSTLSEGWYQYTGPLTFLRSPRVAHAGLTLFALGGVMGWIFSGQLGKSWRVGVHPEQKTELVQSGIYAHIRNPYFLSYFIMFAALFLVRPSLGTALLVIATIGVFHRMVRKEEAYLLPVHGKAYANYRASTGRYLPRWFR